MTLKGCKITNTARSKIFGVACNSLIQLREMAKNKLEIVNESATIVLEDQTIVDNEEYFSTLPPQTLYIFSQPPALFVFNQLTIESPAKKLNADGDAALKSPSSKMENSSATNGSASVQPEKKADPTSNGTSDCTKNTQLVVKPKVYQFKVALKGIKPKIWRRIQVPDTYTFWDLHVAIQDAMGWKDYHIHEFNMVHPITFKKVAIGTEDANGVDVGGYMMRHGGGLLAMMSGRMPQKNDVIPDHTVKISDYFLKRDDKALYEYDFGDMWAHVVTLEEILPADPEARYPLCVNGARACPPEDCGGTEGYKQLIKILSNRNHKEYKEKIEWLRYIHRPEFKKDQEHFDPKEILFTDPKTRFYIANTDTALHPLRMPHYFDVDEIMNR